MEVPEKFMPPFTGVNVFVGVFDHTAPVPFLEVNGIRADDWDEFAQLIDEAPKPGLVHIRFGADDHNPTQAWVEPVTGYDTQERIVLRGLVWTRNPWGPIPGFRGYTITLEKYDGKLKITF